MSDPFVGRTIAHYEVVARVGGGAMGVVYQARDTKLGRLVALKFLPQQWSHDETAKQRFVREAQAASATNHPNICTIHDIETAADGQLFIVMAFYEGRTLKQRLESGQMAIDEALEIATQIADGLAKAHAQGVVHRDIKPGNVILTEDGVRILDFGLATFVDALKLTAENSTIGTPAYMSPEQVQGRNADARSDVWAVGVLLYEMLAGHVPFQGSYAEAIAHAIRHEAPEPLRSLRPEIPEEVEQLVFRALHKEAGVRYQSGRELARALRQVRGLSVPIELRTQAVLTPNAVTPRKRTLWWRSAALATALVVLAVTPVAWWFRPIDRASVVIVPVANQTGDASLQPYLLALTHTLERGLGESRYVRVVPHQQLMQIIRGFLVNGVDASSREAIQAISSNSGASVVVVPALVFDNGALYARAEFLNPATATPQGAAYVTESRISSLTKETAAELIDALASGIDERVQRTHWFVPKSGVITARFRNLDAAKAFEEGVSAFEEFEYSAARTAFETAVREDPGHPLPASWLSRVFRILGNSDEAAKAGAQALSLLSAATLTSERRLVEAIAAEARHDLSVAGARYRDLTNQFQDDPTWLMELGAFHDRQGETAAAVETYHAALRLEGRLVRPHLQLCRLYNSTRMNEAGLAKQHGQKARDGYAALGAAGGEAQALLCLVDILRLGGERDRLEARRYADQALKIFERLGWPFNLARAHHYGALAAQQDDPANAVAMWERSLTGARAVRYSALEAGVLTSLGATHNELGNLAQAADYFDQSFRLNEKRGDDRGAANSQANAGALLIQSGMDSDRGQRYLQTALGVFVRLEDKNFEMFCRKNLAEYFRHVGRYQDAERQLNMAFDIARRHGFDDDLPSLTLEEARWRVETGDYTGGRAAFGRALALGNGPRMEMRLELGRVEVLLGDFDAARKTLSQARTEIASGRRNDLMPLLHTALGALAYEANLRDEAKTEFTKGISLSKEAHPQSGVVEARAYAGLIDALEGRIAQGRRAVEVSLKEARDMRRVAVEARCLVHLARISLLQQRRDEAATTLAGVRTDLLGPELRAQVLYWRAQILKRGAAGSGDSDAQQARRLLESLRDAVPPPDRGRFSERPDIRAILG